MVGQWARALLTKRQARLCLTSEPEPKTPSAASPGGAGASLRLTIRRALLLSVVFPIEFRCRCSRWTADPQQWHGTLAAPNALELLFVGPPLFHSFSSIGYDASHAHFQKVQLLLLCRSQINQHFVIEAVFSNATFVICKIVGVIVSMRGGGYAN